MLLKIENLSLTEFMKIFFFLERLNFHNDAYLMACSPWWDFIDTTESYGR